MFSFSVLGVVSEWWLTADSDGLSYYAAVSH